METEITVDNQTELKVMAQIFEGRTLISTCMVVPGQSRRLLSGSVRFDIFFKNGATGWEVARKLDTDAKSFTLSKHQTRYTVHAAVNNDPIELVAESELAVKRSMK